MFCAASKTENEATKSDRRQSQNSKRHSTHKSSHVLRQKKNDNKTASQDSSSLTEKSDAVPNVTVLTPPLAISLQRTVSQLERCNRTLSSGLAAFTDQAAAAETCEPTSLVPNIVVSAPTDDKGESSLHRDVASDNDNAINWVCDDDKEAVDFEPGDKTACNVETLPAKHNSDDQSTVPSRLTKADNAMHRCSETHAVEGLAACSAVDTEVNISDSSLHLDTQMLCAIAGQAAGDADKTTNILQPAAVVTVPTTDSDKLMSEKIFDTSSELDSLGMNSATCQFMKVFSTQSCTVQMNAVAIKIRDCDEPVETNPNPHYPKPDLSVNITSELVAASNFDRICAAGNDVIAYSEEMLFDDGDHCLQSQSCLTDNLLIADKPKYHLSEGLNNRIASDSAEKLAAENGVENKSDLFASYIEDPDMAVGVDVCSNDLPAENSFGLAHDSLTSTMLDRAMAGVNQASVGNQLATVNPATVGNELEAGSAAAVNPLSDADANFVVENDELRNPQTDTVPLCNAEPPGIDAETALQLLCESSPVSTKKVPKRRGRKRNSDSADPFRKSGTCSVEEKRRRTLSHSPQLFAETKRADVSLNEAVCGHTSFSVSFGSTSDSSAYVPPTPPSTAAEKSNVNTPRRLLGGVAGVTPVKSDHSVHQVSEVKKNISEFKSCKDKQLTQCEASGVMEEVHKECEVKIDALSPPVTQGLHSSQSFTIIDVAANRLLFDTFISEWQRQRTFSLSLACEKRLKPQAQNSRRSTEGIGHKFTRGNQIGELVFKQLAYY